MTTTTPDVQQDRPLPRLKQRYREEIAPSLTSQFGFANPMQVPGVVKVVVNMGVGDAARDSKLIEGAVRDLTAITGQKPVVTTVMSMPRTRSMRSWSISWNIDCSVRPKV